MALPDDRPARYPLLLRALTLDGATVVPVALVQHLAGLVTGLLVYALLSRLGVQRTIATGAAAIVLLEAYTIALEQHVMAESLAMLALAASIYFLIDEDSRPRMLAVSGVLLALAIVIRGAVFSPFRSGFSISSWLTAGMAR